MSAISRLRCDWTGAGVTGGGVSTFYTEGPPAALQAAIKTLFLGTVRTLLPTSVSVVIPASGETLESTTGVLTGTWSAGTAATVPGISGGNFAAGVGARIVWNTPGITRGRRVRGSTYIVPVAVGMYGADGTLTDSNRSDLQSAAHQVIVDCGDDFCVWSRPVGGSGGAIWTILSESVPDKVSWLRSRRT